VHVTLHEVEVVVVAGLDVRDAMDVARDLCCGVQSPQFRGLAGRLGEAAACQYQYEGRKANDGHHMCLLGS
jgi:hypothetical protein